MTEVRFPIETTIGAHSVAKRIEAYAWHLEMDVEVRTVGGWFSKTHYFKAVGSTEAIDKLIAYVDALDAVLNPERRNG